MKYILSTVAATALLLAGGDLATLSAQHSHGGAQPGPQMGDRSTTMKARPDRVLKVGKKGKVTFSSETQVGDVVLNPGKYALLHRIEGADHVMHFAALSNRNSSAEVKCTLEPLESKVPRTLIRLRDTGTSIRLVRMQIKGENVTHVL